MDRRGHADGPAGLPQRQRPHPPSQTGRRARQDLRGEDGPQVRAGGGRPTERRAGRVAGQAPPESAAGAGQRPGARNAMRALRRDRPEACFTAIRTQEFRHGKRTQGTLDTSGSDRIYEDRGGVASRFQHRSGHSRWPETEVVDSVVSVYEFASLGNFMCKGFLPIIINHHQSCVPCRMHYVLIIFYA